MTVAGGGIGSITTWVLGLLVAALGGIILLAAWTALTYATRGTPIRRVRGLDEPRTMPFADLARVLAKTSLAPGHRLTCYDAGDPLFEALLRDVAGAQRLVTWHVFWFVPGRLADRVAEVLVARARAGVPVLMLMDHFGSKRVPASYRRRLEEGGVQLETFRPLRWRTLYKAQHRMHIRAVTVDGRIGYTGGFGIDDHWLGDGRHPGQWRDTSVRVEGPAVAQLQGAFVANWSEATGDLLVGAPVFDFGHRDDASTPGSGPGAPPDAVPAGLLYSSPSLGSTSAERFFVMAIAGARERCWIATGYFVPNRHLRGLLCEAARRGVDVRILTPGGNTDRPSTWYAARAHYRELLAEGVHIHEYDPTMMHAKTLVVDGHWAMVGTLNFDNRSLVLNDEVGLLVDDPGFGALRERAFLADLEHATAITVEAERARTSAGDRVRSWAASRVSRLL